MPGSAWLQAAVIGGLFVALYWPNLHRLWLKVNPISGEPNWGHSIVVPIVGLYYLYVHRDELLAAPVRPLLPTLPTARRVGSVVAALLAAAVLYGVSFAVRDSLGAYLNGLAIGVAAVGALALLLDWGLACLVGGLALGAYGIWPGQNDYVWDCGMVLTLFGTVLTLCGWGVMRFAWFPIAFVVCALPWPPLVYSMVASPLQHLAARVAVGVLQVVQVDASFVGTKIVMPTGRTLNVAEACAGLRSLMTFITLGAAVAFLSDRPLWQKLFITASAVPIAIFCNVMRVSGMGVLDFYVDQGFSEGFAHQFAGLVMLIPAFFLLLAVTWVLDGLFVEEPDEPDAPNAASAAASPAVPAAVPAAAPATR